MGTIGVYGATGCTGQHVARWLAMRGYRSILAGRRQSGLERVAAGLMTESDVMTVDIDDADGLRAFARKCDALIHCAGPFSRYGLQLVSAAVEAGTPHVDHASQPEFVYRVMKDFAERAFSAGIAVVPALSFYTGLAGLIVQSCAPADASQLRVAIGYHVEGWRPTAGTLTTGADLMHQRRVTFSRNEIRLLPLREKTHIASFEFPEPVGRLPVIAGYSGCCEPVTIPRHTATREVQTSASTTTLSDPAFSQRGMSCSVSRVDKQRSDTFVVVVEFEHEAGRRRAWQAGIGDIYRLAALVSVLGVERLIGRKGCAEPG